MGKNAETSAVIDALLELAVGGATISVALLAPNALQVLDKPLKVFFKNMDARKRERELHRTAKYMVRQGLLSGNYEHGLVITKAGRKRAEQADFNKLFISAPEIWDKQWRLVMFDIPENRRIERARLTQTLRRLGFQPLQQSIWIHPFPCRETIQSACVHLGVSQFVTYIVTAHIDYEEKLRTRFRHLL